jgi:hypothetical protein
MKKKLELLRSTTARTILAKMSKEDRLKTVFRRYIEIAFNFGKVVGGGQKGKET